MKRTELLPAEFTEWLRGVPKEEVYRRMRLSIERRAAAAGLSIDPAILASRTEDLDERYFALGEEGRKNESIELFKQARMLAALRFLLDGKEEDALYEFFHSLDDATAAAAISELKTA